MFFYLFWSDVDRGRMRPKAVVPFSNSHATTLCRQSVNAKLPHDDSKIVVESAESAGCSVFFQFHRSSVPAVRDWQTKQCSAGRFLQNDTISGPSN